jgi:XTP/dITP diphosphohydrolase
MRRKLIIATANPGKLKDFIHILGDKDYEFLTLKDIGFTDEIIEDGDSFDANALIKVRAVQAKHPYAILADDSGLCVPALNGEPGIFSARYSGEHGNDQSNNAKLLKNLEGLTDRRAFYHSSLAFKDEEGKEIVFDGQIHGTILEAERGEGGFGYDPMFVPEGETRTFAEMEISEKKSISHRGIAIKKLFDHLS